MDLLKSELPMNLKLYHHYGDYKIKKVNRIKIIENYILSELILKFHPLIDYYVFEFPDYLSKKYEFIFEYDSKFKNELQYIKEVIISKLQECYDTLGSKYNFFVILYLIDHLCVFDNPMESKHFDEITRINHIKTLNDSEKMNFMLTSWKQSNLKYLEFKCYCNRSNILSDFYITDKPKLDSKYTLSNAYKVILKEKKIRIYLKKGIKKYNIVERNVATHVLIQSFDNQMKLISQKIHIFKIKKK